MAAIERELLTRKERRNAKKRWRRPRAHGAVAVGGRAGWSVSPTVCGPAVAGRRRSRGDGAIAGPVADESGAAGVPQRNRPAALATLDMDATVIPPRKRDALPCYKGFKAYQPLNYWWAEQEVMLYSESRDGNVPAGHEQLRVLQETLGFCRRV